MDSCDGTVDQHLDLVEQQCFKEQDLSNDPCDSTKKENMPSNECTEGNNMEEESRTQNLKITELPVEALVHILEFLPLVDRYHASVTCHLFYQAFNDPLLWRKQVLTINPELSNLKTKFPKIFVSFPEKYKILIEKFGKYFQILTIDISGHVDNMRGWTSALSELAKQCRLEKLVLKAGKMTTALDHRGKPPQKRNLLALLSFIENAYRMKCLDIKSWPLFPQTMLNEEQNIFLAVTKNPRFKELEQLDLFWPEKEQMWSERIPVLPDHTVVLELVKHLIGLKRLGIRSTMVSDDLIQELANPKRIRQLATLKIFVTYAKHKPLFQIPHVKSSSWKRLSDAIPDARVECHVMSRVPNSELSNMLSLDCPLSKIVFLQYAEVNSELIESLTAKYHTTLKMFTCYCDINNVDNALMKMAVGCQLLDSLIIISPSKYCIHYKTVMKLAKLRGSSWKALRLGQLNISFFDKYNDEDDDTVIRKNDKGEYVLVGIENYHHELTGEDRGRNMKYFEQQIIKPNICPAFKIVYLKKEYFDVE